MNWGRAKTILIILFLLIDIFLLTLLAFVQNDVSFIKAETVQETIDVLKSRNITINKEQIETKREKNILLELEDILLKPHECAEKFLGGGYKTVRENEDGSVFKKGNSTLFISGEEFSLEESRDINYVFAFKDAEPPLRRDMKKLGFGKNDICYEYYYIKNGVCHIIAFQAHEGKKIDSARMMISADKDGVLNVSGKCYYNISEKEMGGYLVDITSVLCNMIYDSSYHGLNIKDAELCFVVAEESKNESKMYAYPVYKVCDTDNKEYIIDEINR